VLVAIGDVVGHGVGAAILLAGARGVLHRRASAWGHQGELLTHLNAHLARDTGGRRFVTMLLWYIDARQERVCWANAGHDPVLCYDPELDTFTEVGRDGDIPLGIEKGVVYEEHQFGPVKPGQVIVLGTDGIWETRNAAQEYFGRERLMEVVRGAAGGCASEIADAVRLELDAFRGAERQRDDVTLVVVKMMPIANPSDAPQDLPPPHAQRAGVPSAV
jgi:sigma-B regulation protein RsbU (phosphoserine phosphatase)